MTRDEAIHEAGHAVVADALGLRVERIAGSGEGVGCYVVTSEEPSAAEHYAIAAYSLGGGAATLRSGSDPLAGSSEDLDAAKVHILAYCAAEGEPVADTTRRASWLATSIVGDRWSTVEALAVYAVEHDGAGAEAIAEILAPYRSARAARRGDGSVRPVGVTP